jgi:hypothetical protein
MQIDGHRATFNSIRRTEMKISRKPLIALVALGAAFAAPLAFAQSEPTTGTGAQDPATSSQYPTSQDPASSTQDAATQAPPGATAPATEPKQMTWADVDTDKSGTISKTESSQLASLAQVFDDADGDKNGELTPDEYKAFVAKNSAPSEDSGG